MTRARVLPFFTTRLGQNVTFGLPVFLAGAIASAVLSEHDVHVRAPAVGLISFLAWQIGRSRGHYECRDEMRDTVRDEVVQAIDTLLRGDGEPVVARIKGL